MKRRTFFKSLAGSLAGLGFWPAVNRTLAAQLEKFSSDLENATDPALFWQHVRDQSMLREGLAHLNTASLGATPRPIVDALTAYIREVETDPVHTVWGALGEQAELVRQRAADFLGAATEEIILTRNTTEGMNLVAAGLDLKTGDEILTTTHEHGGGMVGWENVAARSGVRIVQIRMPAPVKSGQQILNLVEAHITPRTRVCSFSHVETITGLQMPMADIAGLTRPKGILLVCDGAQAPGMLDVNVHSLGVDTYASSSHKWMLAPKGSGLLYIRKAVQDRIRPAFLHHGYRAYSGSSGTRNVPQFLGHGVAMDFHNIIGRRRVEQRCRELSGYLRRRMRDSTGYRLLAPAAGTLSSGITTYALPSGCCGDIAARLYKEYSVVIKPVAATYVVSEGIASDNYNAVRISTHIYNTEAEIDRACDLLKKMA